MSEETYFTAQDAVEKGFADDVTDAVRIAAHYDPHAQRSIKTFRRTGGKIT